MKFLLLASTALIFTVATPLKAQNISVTNTAKEAKVNKNDENRLYTGEKIIVKQNQTTKGDVRPVAVQDNVIEITGGVGIIKDKIFGADNTKIAVQNNTVIINNGNYGGDIVGGQSYNQSSQNNKVSIFGSNMLGTIFGGISYYLDASNNSVDINESTLAKRALGGQSHEKDAVKNSVKINKSTLREAIYGGYSYQGTAKENSVHIKGSSVGDKLYGGFSRDRNAIDNKLVIEDTTSTDIIYGGASTNGDVTGNDLIIESGNIFGEVYGGYSDFGNVMNNTLTIKNGKFSRNIYDGYSQQGKVANNRINIEGGEFVRTFQIISNYITISNAPSFNPNIIISGRCGPSDPIDVDCLIKFTNYSGNAIAGIANSKKVEIDKDSTVILLNAGSIKIGGDLDLNGTLILRNNGENNERALVVNNLKANDAKILMSNNDFISVTGIAEGNVEINVFFPTQDNKNIMDSYRVFDGETSKLNYKLKNEYILNRNGWHSYKIAKNEKNKNYIDVVSKKTIYANDASLAIPIEIKKDTVDKIELLNKASINIRNDNPNLIVAKDMKIDDSSIIMDYNDYFVINNASDIKNATLNININSAKTGKYKLFMDKDGNTLKTDGFKEVIFSEPNISFNYSFKDGILEITNK